MKKKIIVTGGLGFIGSNLINLLLKKNCDVVNLDKVSYSSNFYNTREYKKIVNINKESLLKIFREIIKTNDINLSNKFIKIITRN